MTKRANSTGLSKAIFSMPLSEGSYPFSLSENEASLSLDNWAWRFLRLNPLYQHDYALWKNRAKEWKDVPRLFTRNGPIVFPPPQDLGIVVHGKGAPPPSLDAVLHLDSRYFMIDGEPLGFRPDKWKYEPVTLGEYIRKSSRENLLSQIRIRDFDAPVDYGIGAWLDPALSLTPDLPLHKKVLNPSWFYHVNEPIWEAGSWAFLRPQTWIATLEDGQELGVGRRNTARETKKRTEFRFVENKRDPISTTTLKIGVPLPAASSTLTATQFRFLVCLEGYVRPQLATAFRLAGEFFELHKKYHPQSVQRGAPAKSVELEELPNKSGNGMNLFSQLARPAVRQRKHWRVVTIDVAAALPKQRKEIEQELKWQQKRLIKVRQRARDENEKKNNALKRALCLVELHLSGSGIEGKLLSQEDMNDAIYCSDTPAYYNIRNLSVHERVAKPSIGFKQQEGHLDRIREGLKLGTQLVLGYYEFEASRQF